MHKATVSIVIDKFADPFHLPDADHPMKVIKPYDMGLEGELDRVRVDPPTGDGSAKPGGAYKDGSIHVLRQGALELTLKVYERGDSSNVYTACGLLFTAFKEFVTESWKPAPGRNTFNTFTCNSDGTLVVEDAAGSAEIYQFVVLIQNYLGGMAIIDPLISNQ